MNPLFVPVVLALTAAAPEPERLVLVEDGRAGDVEFVGAPWEGREGGLEARGTGRRLAGRLEVAEGDFAVEAVLALEGLGHTAASVVLGESHFGLDGRGDRFFVEGPLFGGGPRMLASRTELVRDGVPFRLRVERRGARWTWHIGDALVWEEEGSTGAVGAVALRPHRAAMRVTSLVVEGRLRAPAPPLPGPQGPPADVDVLWRAGEGGYHTYRIPSVLHAGGDVVLAFCEGRKSGAGDAGDIDLLVRRSTDGGRTFGAPRVLWDDGPNTCGNPCPVYDAERDRVVLLMTHNLGHDHEREIIDGKSEGARTVWTAVSEDGGRTFSAPREITESVKRADWTWYATGPGVGIQLRLGERRGRLVVPCDHIEAGTKRYLSHVVYSDDGGDTWQLGGSSPWDAVNECQVIERNDGALVLNMRNYDRTRRTRAVCLSRDAGASFADFRHDPVLVEPICQAGMTRVAPPDPAAGADRVLFSNPARKDGRRRMAVKLSLDGGSTWAREAVLHAGPAAYSCLQVLPDGTVLCLYEAGERSPYESLRLARFPVGWLAE